MPFMNEKQVKERDRLAKAIGTITKINPQLWANTIIERILNRQAIGFDIDAILLDLSVYLIHFNVESWTVDNSSLRGGRTRTVYLSDNQRETIMLWLEVILKSGGSFIPYEGEENE